MGRPNEDCQKHAANVANLRKGSALNDAITFAGISVALSIFTPFGLIAAAIGAAAAVYLLDQWAEADAKYLDDLRECDPTHSSPLTLDLNGDGVNAGAVAKFDHGGDGFAEATRWSDEGDGVLVWDRNGDGVINDGSELFGNNTVLANGEKATHGFAALAELDSNGDGVVNSQDENFADLRVMRWTDVNENGTKSLFFNVKWRT